MRRELRAREKESVLLIILQCHTEIAASYLYKNINCSLTNSVITIFPFKTRAITELPFSSFF